MKKKVLIIVSVVIFVLLFAVLFLVLDPLRLFKKEVKRVNPHAQETNNFPFYPNSRFVKKDETALTATYLWSTADNYDQVSDFFKSDKDNTGWVCSGGTGSYVDKRNANFKTGCTNGLLTYDLYLMATGEKTDIKLDIPIKIVEEKPKQASSKTFENDKYKFTFDYPADYKQFDSSELPADGGFDAGFYFDKFNELYVFIDNRPFKEYEYSDPITGAEFKFNFEDKKWDTNAAPLDPNVDMESVVPKKLDKNMESYRAKTHNDLCFVETLIIPNPTYDFVVEITNLSCDKDFSGYKLDTDKLIDSFKYLEDEQSQTRQFVNSKYGYILTYPKNIPLVGNKNSDTVALNDHLKIKGGSGKNELLECAEKVKSKQIVNGCPKIESQESVRVGDFDYTKITGATGFPATSFITYIMKRNDFYLEFETLAPQSASKSYGLSTKTVPVPQDQITLLDNILKNLRFL